MSDDARPVAAAEAPDAARGAARGATVIGILLIVLGALSIGAPLVAGVAVSTLVALSMVCAGIARGVWAFGRGSLGAGLIAFLLAAALVVGGIVLLLHPRLGLASLTLVLVWFFVFDGIFELVAALRLRPEPGWGWLLFGGIVSLALAWMIGSEWPLSGAWAIGVLVGVKLLFAGTTVLALASAGRRVAAAVDPA